jgi:hypothetical protein
MNFISVGTLKCILKQHSDVRIYTEYPHYDSKYMYFALSKKYITTNELLEFIYLNYISESLLLHIDNHLVKQMIYQNHFQDNILIFMI